MSTAQSDSPTSAPGSIGFWSWELDTRLVRYSPAWAHMVGETLESLGKRLDAWLMRVHADDRPALLQQLKACALGQHQTVELNYRMMHRDGNIIALRGNVEVATRRPDGRALRIVGEQRLAPVAAPTGGDVRLISSAPTAAAAIQQLQNEFIHQADERKLFDSLLQELLAFSGSEFGFIGEVRNADTPAPWLRVTSITNIAWDEPSRNFYARHHTAGLEFHNLKTLFGAAMLTKRPVLSSDPATDPRRGGLPSGHPPMSAFAGIPVFSASKMIGLIGLANRPEGYDEAFLEAVRPLTEGVGSLMRAWQLVRSRLETERAADEVAERLRLATELAGIGVFEWDLFTHQMVANKMLYAMYELTPDGVMLDPRPPLVQLAQFLVPEDRGVMRTLYARVKHGDIANHQVRYRIQRKDGALRHMQAFFAVRRDDRNTPTSLVVTVMDVTERENYESSERARTAAELASHAKSQFLSRMSHELRTPMHAMLGFAQLLEKDQDPPLSAQQRRHVSHVLGAGWHLLGMIDDMLDLARIEAGKLSLHVENTSIGQAVADSVAIVAPLLEEHSVRLTNNVRIDSPVRVQADPRRLRQILINLLSNAAKYNRADGAIIVEAATAVDGQVSLSVRDTGIGIAPERLRSLFTPFDRLGAEQSSTEGTGIGLVITNHLVEMMGGRLVVASTYGQGSVFTVSLPRGEEVNDALVPVHVPAKSPAEAQSMPERDIDATVPMSRDVVAATLGRRSIVERAAEGRTDRMLGALQAEPILIVYVEDNALNASLLRLMMAPRPQVQIEVAINGHDGIEMVRALTPKVVLVDLNLPDMHGLDLLGKLRADPGTRDIPCIAVSADALPQQIEAAKASGFADYLVKPLKVDDLLARIDRWVGKAGPTSPDTGATGQVPLRGAEQGSQQERARA